MINGLIFNFITTVISYQMLDIKGSGFAFASVWFVNSLPKILFTMVGGFAADFFDRKRLYILIDIFGLLIISIMFICGMSSNLSLYLYSFCFGLLKAFSTPVTKSIVPLVSSKKKLLRTNSFEISNDKIARTLGPVAVLFLIPLFGSRLILSFSFVSYLTSIIMKYHIVLNPIDETQENDEQDSPKVTIFEGLSDLFTSSGIFLLFANALITQFIFHPLVSTALPSILQKMKYNEDSTLMAFFIWLAALLGKNKKKVWMNLSAVINLGGALGVLISFLYIVKVDKSKEKRGINLGVAGQIFFGLMVSITLYYYLIVGDLPLDSLVLILTILNCGLYFSFNIFTIFFSMYYQREINKSSMGRFVGAMMVMFSLFYSAGSLIYGYAVDKNLHLSIGLLLTGIIAKAILHIFFIHNENRKEIVEEV